jgi:riboflavin synthase
MFTGIIESQGILKEIIENGSNRTFWIKSPISSKLKPDQSVAHDGVCLTVEAVKGNQHRVTAIAETLSKSNLGGWEKGHCVNLERCLKINARLDGHFVQGHIDTVGICQKIIDKKGSREFHILFPAEFSSLMIDKGSVAINGISLTAFNVTNSGFDVAIIPYTLQHTNLSQLQPEQKVNIEFDLIGKYINRKLSLTNQTSV